MIIKLYCDFSSGNVGPPLRCNYIKLVDVPDMNYNASDDKGEVCIKGHNVFKVRTTLTQFEWLLYSRDQSLKWSIFEKLSWILFCWFFCKYNSYKFVETISPFVIVNEIQFNKCNVLEILMCKTQSQ